MSETVTTGATTAPTQGSSGAQASSTPSTNAQGGSSATNVTPGQGQAAPTGARGNPASGNAQGSAQAPTDATAAQARKLGASDMDALVEVKIDGRIQEIPLKEVIRLQQLEKASRQKMSEAQRERQQAMQERELAKKDPERYMREVLGMDPKGWAEKRLAKEYDLAQMSPEARRAMELEQELGAVKAREAKTREPILAELKNYVTPEMYEQVMREAPNATLEQVQAFANQKRAEFQAGVDQTSNELLAAWEQTGLPRQKDFGQWMAQVMVDHSKKSAEHKKRTGEDLPPLQPSEAAVKVKARFLNSTKSLFSQMDAQAIQEALGPEVIQKLRQFDVESVSSPQTPPWASSEQRTQTQSEKPKTYLNQTEWRKAIGLD